MRNFPFFSSESEKIHLLPHQELLRLPGTAEGALPVLNTALLLGAAEGNGIPYKRRLLFSLSQTAKLVLQE